MSDRNAAKFENRCDDGRFVSCPATFLSFSGCISALTAEVHHRITLLSGLIVLLLIIVVG